LDNPCFTNGLSIQAAIKNGKDTEAYTEKLTKAMEFVNEHGDHPVLSQCICVPFGRGAAIDKNMFCSLIHMQNKFIHNIKHVKIDRLSDIDLECHTGNDSNDGEYYSNNISELLVDKAGKQGQQLFHAIECTMQSDTTHALLSKQNEDQFKLILSDIDNWLCSKFIDAVNNLSFHQSPGVRVSTSSIEQRKTKNQVKFNAYSSRIAKRFCTENPNEATDSFDTAPDRMPRFHINLTYVAAVTTVTPCLAQPPT
jgi:hypothetical protein